MTTITVKKATTTSLEATCRLFHEFHEFHVQGVSGRLLTLGEQPKTYAHSELYHALVKIIEDANAVLFVAEAGDELIGFAEIYIREDEPNPLKPSYRYGYLQSLFVKEEFRRQRIGVRLLDAAQQWTREKGATEMRLEIWEFESGPLHFYEKNNYRTLQRTLVRAL